MSLAGRAGFVLLPLAALAMVAALLVRFDLPLAGAIEWIPALGISLAWRIDGLAALMLLMITGVASAVFVYTGSYFSGHPGQRRLYVQLTLFTALSDVDVRLSGKAQTARVQRLCVADIKR